MKTQLNHCDECGTGETHEIKLPWVATKSGEICDVYGTTVVSEIIHGDKTAIAQQIVQAVNAHETLVQMLRDLNYAFYVEGTPAAMKLLMSKTKDLIAKAEGR